MASRRGGFFTFCRTAAGDARLRCGVLAALLVLTVGLLGYVLLSGRQSEGTQEAFSNVITIAVALLMPVTCSWAAVRAHGRTRLAWWLMAAAGASWLLGESVWLLETYLWFSETVPALSDLYYLMALLPAAGALIVFPPPPRPGGERVRTVLTALVVIGSVLFVSRTLVLSLVLPTATGSVLARAVYIAYPTADVVLASLALIVLVRVGSRARLHFLLLAAGFLVYSVSDTVYVREAALDSYASGSLIDLGWVAGYALFALAPLVPEASLDAAESRTTAQTGPFDWSSLAVYVPLLVAVVVAAMAPSPRPDRFLIATGLLTLVLFAFRQALLAGDDRRLRAHLQQQLRQLEVGSTELRQLALQNERVVQSVVDGVVGVDAQGRVTFVNPRAVAMLGRSEADLVGSPESLLFADLAPEATAEQDAPGPRGSDVSKALVTGTVVASARARFRRGDGSSFPVELAVGPIREANEILGAVVVFRDVSARLAVEKMKNEFVSVVSHELRTPLTSIRGSLGLLAAGKGGELSSQGSRMVTIALESSERLTRLIEDMLDLERMESGSLTMVPIICEIRPLVNTALNEVDAMGRRYGVTVDAGDVDGVVRGDPDRIVQTLTNLLGNSIKFSPRGGTVRVSAGQRGPLVEFAIIDRGRGIPADRVERIFERFEQVDSSDSRERGGTGLGLSISRDIIELHGGSIWVESELGHGSTFRFTLPGTMRRPVVKDAADPQPQPTLDRAVT